MELAKTNTPPPPCPQIRLGKIESTLARGPKYGVFPWWPDDSDDWVHPNDLEIAKQFVPGSKILLRVALSEADSSGEFLLYGYGSKSFRAKPRMWLEVPQPDYELFDQVEICSKLGKVRPKIATISEVSWNRLERVTEYRLIQNELPVPKIFHASDLQPVVRLGETMPLRHLERCATISRNPD